MSLPPNSIFLIAGDGVSLYESVTFSNDQVSSEDPETDVYAVTSAGTVLLTDSPHANGVSGVQELGHEFIYRATAQTGLDNDQITTTLYGTNGTKAGTNVLFSEQSVTQMRNYGEANGHEIIQFYVNDTGQDNDPIEFIGTDGTPADTQNLIYLSQPHFEVQWTGAFYSSGPEAILETFAEFTNAQGGPRYETQLWETDGTSAGTILKWDFQGVLGVSHLPTPLVSDGLDTRVDVGSSVKIRDLSVLELFTGNEAIRVRLHATHGALSTSAKAGRVVGDGTSSLLMVGTLSHVNKDLAHVSFTGASKGTAEISVVAQFEGVKSPVEKSSVAVHAHAPAHEVFAGGGIAAAPGIDIALPPTHSALGDADWLAGHQDIDALSSHPHAGEFVYSGVNSDGSASYHWNGIDFAGSILAPAPYVFGE